MNRGDGETWTYDDLEEVAQASLRHQSPPPDVIERLGSHPPRSFTWALGRRMVQLAKDVRAEES